MVTEETIVRIDDIASDSERLEEEVNRLASSEPTFAKWMQRIARNSAEKHARKIAGMIQGSINQENFMSQVMNMLVSSHMACLSAGFMVHETHVNTLWMKMFGMNGPSEISAKLNAFLSGTLPAKEYEGLDMKNPVNAAAVDNFKRRKQVQDVLNNVSKK